MTRGAWRLLLVPLLLGFGAGAWYRDESLRRATDLAEHRLDAALTLLSEYAEAEPIWSRLLARHTRRVLTARDPAAAGVALANRLRRNLGLEIDLVLVDRAGHCLAETGGAPVPRQLLRRFVADYRAMIAGDPAARERQRGFIHGYFGPCVQRGRVLHDRLLFAGVVRGGHRYVFLSPPTRRGMVLLRLLLPPDRPPALVERMVQVANRRAGPLRFRVCPDPRVPDRQPPASRATATPGQLLPAAGARDPLDPASAARAIAACTAASDGRARLPDGTWQCRPLGDGWLLLGRHRPPPALTPPADGGDHRPPFGNLAGRTGLALFLLGLTLAGWVGWRRGGDRTAGHRAPPGEDGWFIPVRVKLTAAFIYAAGVPLAILAVAVTSYLGERREVLIDRQHERATRALAGFDRAFDDVTAVMRHELPTRFINLRVTRHTPLASLTAELAGWRDRYRWTSLQIFDLTARCLFQAPVRPASDLDHDASQVFADAGVLMLRRMITGPEARRALAPLPARIALSPGRTVHTIGIHDSFNLVGMANFADTRFALGGFPIFDERRRPWLLALVAWSREWLERDYVRSRLASGRPTEPDLHLFADHYANPAWSWPRHPSLRRPVARLANRLRSRLRAVRATVRRDDETLILTGIRGQQLSEFGLVAVATDGAIRLELAWLRWLFTTVGATLIAAMIAVGSLLARRFVEPIRILAGGVADLAGRHFERRLPVLAADELGALTAAYNAMMADTADLEVARAVQDGLFPPRPLTSGGWTVHGQCRSALRVGGDFYDHRVLADGSLALLIGDATGHGVAASLIAAMAKVVSEWHAAATDPEVILLDLHRCIRQSWQGFRLMTALAIRFDPATRHLKLVLAGQNHPFRVGPGAAATFGAPSTPLGAGKRPRLAVVETTLAPDETVIVYTDCLIEALTASGRALGYQHWQDRLPRLIGESAIATETAVRGEHAAATRGGLVDDDLTIVVLQAGAG